VSAKILIAAALASLFVAGCASATSGAGHTSTKRDCEYLDSECRYKCNRDYQACKLQGSATSDCINQIGKCTLGCEFDLHSCQTSQTGE
jgi:hypothetical protein